MKSAVVAAVPSMLLAIAACGLPGTGGVPSGACRLPTNHANAAQAADSGPFVEVAGGCPLYLGEADNGRRLRVQLGTAVHVDLPSGGNYGPPSAESTGADDILSPVAHNGNSLTLRAGAPGLARIFSNQPNVKSPPVTWEVAIEVGGIALTQPVFTSATTGWALSQDGESILRSTDGGLHWATATPPGARLTTPTHLDFVSDSVAWIAVGPKADGAKVFRTADGGASWTAAPTVGPGLDLLDLSATDADHSFLLLERDTLHATETGRQELHVFVTTDGARSWREVSSTSSGAPTAPSHLRNDCQAFAIDFATPATGWATGPACKPYLLDVTRDGGATWSRQTLPAPPQAQRSGH
jgi:photosystem II stability/assembly factor-like uncharacterized protein